MLGAGQVGFWEGGGGWVNWVKGNKWGHKQPEREVDDSCHIWREPSKWKGTQRGGKGELAGRARGVKGIVPCIYVNVMYVPE